MVERMEWKLRLIRRLYEKQYERNDIIQLFQFIDWLMELPQVLSDRLWGNLREYEEERKVEYITTVERIGIAKGEPIGIAKGEQIGIAKGYHI